MITIVQCKDNMRECKQLGIAPEISIQRATAIMAICNAWTALERHVARYEAIVKAESE